MIELLVVLVIISILSVVAYPAYTQFTVKAKRSAAHAMLTQVADRQQQFFMDNKRYATDLTELNFPADPFVISDEGHFVDATEPRGIYRIDIADVAASAYTISAEPVNVQAQKDTKCGTLTYSHTGTKGASGAIGDCW
jgi:type IV pilus assembly protein PilE